VAEGHRTPHVGDGGVGAWVEAPKKLHLADHDLRFGRIVALYHHSYSIISHPLHILSDLQNKIGACLRDMAVRPSHMPTSPPATRSKPTCARGQGNIRLSPQCGES
jgi:hypothetical protein